MVRRKRARQVVLVERVGDSSAKWLFWGAVLGAGVALLYAPQSGEETRRSLQRTLWKVRAMTEEKLDEIADQFGGAREALRDLAGEGEDEDLTPGAGSAQARSRGASAREELERRLAEARARRRASPDLEEPLA